MAMKATRQPRTTRLAGPLVLAFLLVFTGLGALMPQPVQADLSDPILGTVMVTTEPDYELPDYDPMGAQASIWYPWHGERPGIGATAPQTTTNPIPNYPKHPAVIYAKPGRTGDLAGDCSAEGGVSKACFQRTVRLSFGDGPGPNRIDFVSYIRDSFATPPCNASAVGWARAMDPCKDMGAIIWRPEFSYVTRPGWKVSDNLVNQLALGRGYGDLNAQTSQPPAFVLSFETIDGSLAPGPSFPTGSSGFSCASARLMCALDFVIAFQVQGSPEGDQGMENFPQTPPDEFHIQINRYPSGSAASFETTCQAKITKMDTNSVPSPQSPFTCVHTSPPFACYAPPGPDNSCAASSPNTPPQFKYDPPIGQCTAVGKYCGTPSLVIRMDDTPPAVLEPLNGDARFGPDGPPPQGTLLGPTPCVCSFVSYDTDHNGRIDRFAVSFTEPLDPDTFNAKEFAIQTKGRDRPYTITNAFFEPWNPLIPGEQDGQCITGTKAATTTSVLKVFYMPGSTCRVIFQVAEMPFYDSGDKPALTYPLSGRSTITDRAGNPLGRMSGSTITAVDRAPPILVSAWGLDPNHRGGVREAGSYLHIFFSENVIGSASAFTATGFQPGAVQISDLCYQDGLQPTGATWPNPAPPAPAVNVIGANVGGTIIQGCFAMNAPYDDGPGGNADDNSGACAPNGFDFPCRYFQTLYHAPADSAGAVGTAGGNGWRMAAVTMTDPDDTANRLTFGIADTHPFYGDMVGVRASGVGMSRNCRESATDSLRERGPDWGDADNTKWYPCNSNVRDLNDNGAWYPPQGFQPTVDFPHPPALAQVTFPLIESATVDVSDPDCKSAVAGLGRGPQDPNDLEACHYWLKLKFNGPVRGPTNPAGCDTAVGTAKSPKPFLACNIDIKTAAGTGQGPQGFLGPAPVGTTGAKTQFPYYLVGDSDTAILQMDQPARPFDVSLTPSQVKVDCGTIFATPGFSPGLEQDQVSPNFAKFSLWPSDQSIGAIPCDDPDQYYGPDQDADPDNGGVLKRPDVDIVDRTPPRILDAKTVDADSDGYLDGVRLTFSEPIDDATFCGGGPTVLSAPDYCQGTEVPGDQTGFFAFSRWSGDGRIRAMVDVHQEECKAGQRRDAAGNLTGERHGFRWDTGQLSNDNTGVIQFVSVERSGDAWITRVANCEEYFQGRWTGRYWPTDEILHLTTISPDMVKDMASRPFHDNSDLICTAPTSPCYLTQSPNGMPTLCQYESRAFGLEGLGYPNDLAAHPYMSGVGSFCDTKRKSTDSIRVTDGAPPVIWRAMTYDTPMVDFNGVARTKPAEKYLNVHGDGTLDGYRLIFSEPVRDSSFDPKDWKIEGFTEETIQTCTGTTETYISHAVTKDTWLVKDAPMRTYDTTLNNVLDADADAISNAKNDPMFILLFTPAKEKVVRPDGTCEEFQVAHNTDAKPDLTAGTPGQKLHLADYVGNPMLAFDSFAIQEEDNVAPQIWRVEGFQDTDRIKVYFSEPVDDGGQSGLVRDDFQYFDKNFKDIAGMSSTQPIAHQPGDRMATLFLGGMLTASDQSLDKIAVRDCKVYETAPSVRPEERKCVPGYPRALLQESDTTAPGAITDFRLVDELAKANSLTATWTAPGDDDTGGGAVTAYDCRVSEAPLTANTTTDVLGILPKFDPPMGNLAIPGRTQTVTLVNLDSEKTYHVSCAAVDELGNQGTFSASDSGKTRRDTTPPTGVIEIESTTHPEGKATAKPVATFRWNDIGDTDPESTVTYHYKLTTDPNYIVLAVDGESTIQTQVNQNVPDGEWYFHVAGFSAGGATPTAHYHVIVGLPPLDPATIEAANDKVVVKPYRQEDVFNGELVVLNNVTWTLPPVDTPPGLEDITGIEIWRNDNGVFRKITTVSGTYDELQTGFFRDVTAGANAESKYRVNMVFAASPNTQEGPVKGFTALEDQTPTPYPPWIFVLAGIFLALVLSGLVIYFILRRRQAAEALGGVAYSWESANPELLGIDEATGLPVHEVRCPSCNNPFQAVGALPLPVTCPTCGTTGMLD